MELLEAKGKSKPENLKELCEGLELLKAEERDEKEPTHKRLAPGRSCLRKRRVQGLDEKELKVTKTEVKNYKANPQTKANWQVWNENYRFYADNKGFCEACGEPIRQEEGVFFPLEKPSFARDRFYCQRCRPDK